MMVAAMVHVDADTTAYGDGVVQLQADVGDPDSCVHVYVWCQTTLQGPRLCPQLLTLYPPLFRCKCVFCFPQKVLSPISPKLEILGNLQGTRRTFFCFLRRSIGN